MGYAETMQRVAAIDRMIVEHTAAARSTPPAPNAQFDQLLQASLAPSQAAGAAASGPFPGSLMPGVSSAELMEALAAGRGGMLPANALASAYAPAAQPAEASMLRGDVDGLDPELKAGLEQVARAIGKPLEIISGLRTREEQEELYRRYLNGTGNLAAVPGTSRHESGRAADVYVNGVALANVDGARAAATAAGLGFPVPGEAWHVERINQS